MQRLTRCGVAEVPLDALSREQKILLLKRLRSKLCSLVAALTAKQSGAPITRVLPPSFCTQYTHVLHSTCSLHVIFLDPADRDTLLRLCALHFPALMTAPGWLVWAGHCRCTARR